MTDEIDLRAVPELTATSKEVLKKSLVLLDDEFENGELTAAEYARAKEQYLSYGAQLLEPESVLSLIHI